MNPNLSFYNNSSDIDSSIKITYDNFIDTIRNPGTHTDTILKIRQLRAEGKPYKQLKKNLPLVTVSGTFKTHTDAGITQHSGLLCLDFDHFDTIEDAECSRDKLASDPFVKCAFLSASGNLAVIIEIDPARHQDSFTCLSAYFSKEHELVVDESGRNVSRYRFLSYDPEMLINLNSGPYAVREDYIEAITVSDEMHASTPLETIPSDVVKLIARINETGIDITSVYSDWVKICFALARNCNGNGLEYFHEISKYNPDYNQKLTTNKFNSVKKSVTESDKKENPIEKKIERKTTLKSLFAIAKDYGIRIRPDTSTVVPGSAFTQVMQTAPVDNGEIWTIFDQIRNVLEDGHDIKFNSLTMRVDIDGLQIDDYKLNDLWQYVTKKFGGKVPDKNKLLAVMNSSNWPKYNPIKLYFESIPAWDHIDRITQMAQSMNSEQPDVTAILLPKWLTGMVHCLFGTPNPLVLVLVGKMSTGKSRFFADLLPQDLKSYFCESHLLEKDVVNNMNQNLIVYDDEMVGIKKMGVQAFKALTSSAVFSLTRKFETFETKLDRIATIGTTSNEFNVIDEDQNRRFLPIHISENMDWQRMNAIDRTQLMAQLYYNYKTSYNWELAGEDIARLHSYSTKFKNNTVEDDLILKYCELPDSASTRVVQLLTATEIMEMILSKSTIKIINKNNIGKAMKKAGFVEVSNRRNGAVPRYYWQVIMLL